MKEKKLSKAKIADYIYNEYIYNQDLKSGVDLVKEIELLVDNGLAVKIEGHDDIYYTNNLSRYKVASLFLLGYDKKLKQNIKPLLPLEESNLLNFGPTENGEKIKKLIKSGLEHGFYTVVLEDKKSDEYAIFEVSQGSDYDKYNIKYTLYFVGNKCEKYKDKFFKLCEKYQKYYSEFDKDKTYITMSGSEEEQEVQFKSFEQMVFKQKESVKAYIDNWVENIPKYHKYGITPKLSILLYGKPGTGKSTFYKAVAKYLGLKRIICIEPEYFYRSENDKSKVDRTSDDGSGVVYAIDEVDCICKSRTEKSDDADNDKVLSKLLAFLDNPKTFYFKAKDGTYYPVSIIVATTNYIDKLDDAVKRFGRFDLQIEMVDFDEKYAEEFCNLYDLHLSDVVDDIPKDFTISPAKLQALCMENIDKALKKN